MKKLVVFFSAMVFLCGHVYGQNEKKVETIFDCAQLDIFCTAAKMIYKENNQDTNELICDSTLKVFFASVKNQKTLDIIKYAKGTSKVSGKSIEDDSIAVQKIIDQLLDTLSKIDKFKGELDTLGIQFSDRLKKASEDAQKLVHPVEPKTNGETTSTPEGGNTKPAEDSTSSTNTGNNEGDGNGDGGDDDKSENAWTFVPYAVILLLLFIIYLNIKRIKRKNIIIRKLKAENENLRSDGLKASEKTVHKQPEIPETGITLVKIPVKDSSKWLIVGDSVIGRSHVDMGKPCQDNHCIEKIDEHWGVAVSCDGAGSARLSEKGSKAVSQIAAKKFKELVIQNNWHASNTLPGDEEWDELALATLKQVYANLKTYTENENLAITDLACTIIVTVYSPVGLLVTHIGDGRAGYCDSERQWFPAMIPHKGVEANQTIFITSVQWLTENLRMSGVSVPESRVIATKPSGFTLMSDGCETHTFECSLIDPGTGKWSDPNKPSERLFKMLTETLMEFNKEKLEDPVISEKWKKYLESGNPGLENEPDDKTMILGIIV